MHRNDIDENFYSTSGAGREPTGIVIVSPGGTEGGGGIGSVTRAMADWLSSHKPNVRIDVLDPRGAGLDAFGLGPGYLWPFLWLRSCIQLISIRLRYRSEILHLQVSRKSSFFRKGTLLLLGRLLGMKTVLHHHGSEFIQFYDQASPVVKAFVRWVATTADVNIVLGERWRSFLTRELNVADEQIVIKFNAAQDLRNDAAGLSADPRKMLIAANLTPRKGIGELLEAISALAKTGDHVSLTLAGGGEIERYRAEAQALGIADRCTFTGWISGAPLHKLFREHGALVLPSHNEGLPMAIIEALGAELPVIATPVGSIPEVLTDGKTCLFVQPGNVDELAKAISRIATDADLSRDIKRQGRVLYEERFELNTYMKGMLELYG